MGITTDQPARTIAWSHAKNLNGIVSYFSAWHKWYWTLIPVAAIFAYLTVLRIGFLADDFFQLNVGRIWGLDPFAGVRDAIGRPGFLRPVGVYVIYQLGWALWGYNPLPYHVAGLLAHAASSLALGLWLNAITSKRSLGLLAGLLFAVFPLHLEAVGWVGAQFDTYSVLFGLCSLLYFTLWWRSNWRGWAGWALYVLSVLLYVFSIFTKESLLTFLPVFAVSAWVASAPNNWRKWRRLGYSLLPFCAAIWLNLGFRYVMWGGLGGYGSMNINYSEFLWDNLIVYSRLLLSPLNEAVFGKGWLQIVGTLATVGLLVGLTVYGRDRRRLLMLAGLWLGLTLLPVLNLALASDNVLRNALPVLMIPPGVDNLQQNRYLYLPSAGYCVAVAVLLHGAVESARHWRSLAVGFAGALLVLCSVASWVQLRPWHTATVQSNELVDGLIRLIPPQRDRANGIVWFVQDVPFKYKGVPLFFTGLGLSRLFRDGDIDYPQIVRVPNAAQAPIASDTRDAYAMRFYFDETATRFWVDYAAGVTNASAPPTPSQSGDNLRVWDFRGCAPAVTGDWQVEQAQVECRQGMGLLIKPGTADPKMITLPTTLQLLTDDAKSVRVRASVRYKLAAKPEPYVSEWFWKSPASEYSVEQVRALPAKQDGQSHVYWVIVPVKDAGRVISGLRFDPINSQDPVEVNWISIDLVR